MLRRSSRGRDDRLTEDRKNLIERYAVDAAEAEAQIRRAAEERARSAAKAEARRIISEERERLAAADEFRFGSVAPFPRVLAACAAYRGRFGRWPTELRVHPVDLQGFARLPSERWFQFTHRVALTSDWTVGPGPRVRGAEGEVRYDDDGIVDDHRRVADTDVENWLLSAPTEPIWE